jgi:hypothetical protein
LERLAWIGLLIPPPIAYVVTYWICLGLHRSDGTRLTYQGAPVPHEDEPARRRGQPETGRADPDDEVAALDRARRHAASPARTRPLTPQATAPNPDRDVAGLAGDPAA